MLKVWGAVLSDRGPALEAGRHPKPVITMPRGPAPPCGKLGRCLLPGRRSPPHMASQSCPLGNKLHPGVLGGCGLYGQRVSTG